MFETSLIKIALSSLIIIVLYLEQVSIAQNYIVGRQPYTCYDTEDPDDSYKRIPFVSGWFWDSQKCEPCILNCKTCKSYGTCDECLSGYGYNNYTSTCDRCQVDSSDLDSDPLVTSCCWLESGTNYIGKKNFQALSCRTNAQLIGGVCNYIIGCVNYTSYGKCYECDSGYYLNEEGNCDSCNNPSVNISDPNFFYDFYDEDQIEVNNDNNAIYATTYTNNCSQCNSKYQCTKCANGYYLATNVYQPIYDLNIARHPSICIQCGENCLCNDGYNMCVSCIDSDLMYKDLIDNKCLYCNETISHCSACSWVSEYNDIMCSECEEGYGAYEIYKHGIAFGYKCYSCSENATQIFSYDDELNNQTCDSSNIYILTQNCLQNVTQDDYFNQNISFGDPNCRTCSVSYIDITNVGLLWGSKVQYCDCTECDNGWVEYTTSAVFQLFEVSTQTIFYQVDVTKCMKCPTAIRQQLDELAEQTDLAGYATNTYFLEQHYYVRRCLRLSTKSVMITQCGNSRLTWYPQDDKNGYDPDPEYQLRGPNIDYTTMQPLQSNYYVVLTSDLGNMCVKNVNSCKVILSNLTFSTITSDPICDSCYTDLNYVLTTKKHCKQCKLDNCLKCNYSYETVANSNVESPNDNLICIECTTGLDRSLWSDSLMQNYFLNSSNLCSNCSLECKTCEYSGTNCSSCQMGFEKEYNQTLDEWHCINNTIKYCLQTSSDVSNKVCIKCIEGYSPYQIRYSAADYDTLIVICMKCDDLCYQCNNTDYQLHNCNRCKAGNYLDSDTNICQIRYNGCVKEIDELDCVGVYPNRQCKCQWCEYGYRLIYDRCYKCFDPVSGFIHCAGQCSNDYSFSSNVRNMSSTR